MKKARIEYFWVPKWDRKTNGVAAPTVYWQLRGANGEIVCQSSQGHRDKTDARRAVDTVVGILALCASGVDDLVAAGMVREVGPGRKPKAGG